MKKWNVGGVQKRPISTIVDAKNLFYSRRIQVIDQRKGVSIEDQEGGDLCHFPGSAKPLWTDNPCLDIVDGVLEAFEADPVHFRCQERGEVFTLASCQEELQFVVRYYARLGRPHVWQSRMIARVIVPFSQGGYVRLRNDIWPASAYLSLNGHVDRTLREEFNECGVACMQRVLLRVATIAASMLVAPEQVLLGL